MNATLSDERLDNLERDERLDRIEAWKESMERRFADAFPGGDHVGHCRYHELMIKQIEERRALRIAIQTKTISGLVWAGIIGLGYALWEWLKTQVRT